MSATGLPIGGLTPPGIEPAQIVLPSVGYGFSRHMGDTILLTISLPPLPLTFQIPWDRVSFAKFVRDAQSVLPINGGTE